MEKTPADIIILYKCTKNHDHILYYSWDIVRDGCNCYFSFWAIFALLHAPPPSAPPVTAWKMKMKKKKKKIEKKNKNKKTTTGGIIFASIPKIMMTCCTVPEIWCMTYVIISHFGLFFALLPLKISKKSKKLLEISAFYTCVPKMMIRWCMVSGIWYPTDGCMDRWTEKVTHRGGCPT